MNSLLSGIGLSRKYRGGEWDLVREDMHPSVEQRTRRSSANVVGEVAFVILAALVASAIGWWIGSNGMRLPSYLGGS